MYIIDRGGLNVPRGMGAFDLHSCLAARGDKNVCTRRTFARDGWQLLTETSHINATIDQKTEGSTPGSHAYHSCVFLSIGM